MGRGMSQIGFSTEKSALDFGWHQYYSLASKNKNKKRNIVINLCFTVLEAQIFRLYFYQFLEVTHVPTQWRLELETFVLQRTLGNYKVETWKERTNWQIWGVQIQMCHYSCLAIFHQFCFNMLQIIYFLLFEYIFKNPLSEHINNVQEHCSCLASIPYNLNWQ